jgi:predicted nucleic acid-binding protein
VRIVLDTNVALSALLEELADVLTRPSAAKRLALIDKTASAVLADYVDAIELVEPVTVPRVVVGDVDDDQVIAAVVAARAVLIVSGDRKHLLPLGSHQGIGSVEAAEAIRRIAAGA